ncbi:hypothetical protein HMI54_014984 [Coelomomyces lativittatus]|nr:hypothetical protein HMI56_007384 [Coelomomyces lativittatus]KAJ1513468.1 hypothetical protein HMI54_014984 [Coelomomyces lativittatus]
MTPFSMRCNTCGEYIYKGKKFNARKRTVEGESYYRIKIYRFYIRCPGCSAEITFKTDPGSMDYVAESGAMRNFEPWRDEEKVSEQSQLQRRNEEELNPMKALENKTLDAKKEMEISEALDEIRTLNARHDQVHLDHLHQLLEKKKDQGDQAQAQAQAEAEDEDAALAKSVFQSSSSLAPILPRPTDLSFSSTFLPSKRKQVASESSASWSQWVVKKSKPTPSSSSSTSLTISPNDVSTLSPELLSSEEKVAKETTRLGLAYSSDDDESLSQS